MISSCVLHQQQQRQQPKMKRKKKGIKVVYISSPMRVEASASQFRSLVQELTGRDSDHSIHLYSLQQHHHLNPPPPPPPPLHHQDHGKLTSPTATHHDLAVAAADDDLKEFGAESLSFDDVFSSQMMMKGHYSPCPQPIL
ncbi:hypothetical protein ACLOJK_000245 [Asimina triloba]